MITGRMITGTRADLIIRRRLKGTTLRPRFGSGSNKKIMAMAIC